MGSNSFVEMQQSMQRELLRNPDMLRQVMDNPIVQQIMGDPNNMRQLILSNPQMQELIEVKFCHFRIIYFIVLGGSYNLVLVKKYYVGSCSEWKPCISKPCHCATK